MSLTYFLAELFTSKEGTKEGNENLGYEEATRESKHEWVFLNERSHSTLGSSSPFCSPFPFAAADL